MLCTTIFVAATFQVFVGGQGYYGPARCGCLEEPASGTRRKDRFCRPHLVPRAERNKHRNCVCRPGLLRNSWGDCITKQECTKCKCHPNKDFNICARECPVMCNEPVRTSCSQECAFGCDCPPGMVRDPRRKNRCVKATKCSLRCPEHSKFEFCVSTCAPKCGRRQRSTCTTRCQRGGCVCDAGYAEVEHNGEAVCVPRGECSRYLKIAVPLRPGEHGNIGGGLSSGRVTSVFTGGTLGTGSQGAAVTHQGSVITGGVVSVPSTGTDSTMVMASTGAPQRIPPTSITAGVSPIPAIGIGTAATVAAGIGARPPGFTVAGGSLSHRSSGVVASPRTIRVTGSPSAVRAPVTNVSGTVGIVATGAGGSLQGVPPISVNGVNTVRAVTTPAGRGTPQLGFSGGPQSATGGDAAAHRTGSGGGMPGPAVTVPVQSISGSGLEGVVHIPSSGVGTNTPIITNMNGAYFRAPYGVGSITGGTYNGATATGNTIVHGEDRSTGGISGSHFAHPGPIHVSRPSFSTGTGTSTRRGTPGISVGRSGYVGGAGPAPKIETSGTVIETGSSGNILLSTSGINAGT